MTLAFHPLATIFPPIEGAEFEEFVENIRRHGVREKIVVWHDQVLEGRNRYRALAWLASTGELLGKGWGHREGLHLTAAELEPDNVWFTQFNPEVDGDALSFVLSKNLHRRHLTESQRSMVAVNIANMKQGQRTDLPSIEGKSAMSQSDAAKALNVSVASVERAAAVKAHALPEIADAVARGDLKVSAAAEVASLPAERQQQLLADLPRDADGKLTSEARKALAPVIKEVRAEKLAAQRGRREEREADLGKRLQSLPDRRFGVILADPEWRFEPYSRESGMDRAADNHYPTSPTEAICARDVPSIAAADCVLFLWATAPMLPDGLQVMAAWGFTYKTHLVWKKDKVGNGYWVRNRHELLLIGTRGNVPAPAMGDQWPSVVDAMVQEHSAKPEMFYELIEQYFPNLPKIELNARRAREGWESWGLEAPATHERPERLPHFSEMRGIFKQDNPDSNPPRNEIDAADGAAARAEGRIHPATVADHVTASPGDVTEHANAHGCTASDAAPAAATAAGAPLPALEQGARCAKPQGADELDIPAFLRRRAPAEMAP